MAANENHAVQLYQTLSPLTTRERRDFERAERTIARGLKSFMEVGMALKEIRDRRLYRQQYDTFEEYCVRRWDVSRPRAYELCAASEVVADLSAIADIQLLPENEAQARPLTRLKDPAQWRRAWQTAVKLAAAEKRPVTARDTEEAVRRLDGNGSTEALWADLEPTKEREEQRHSLDPAKLRRFQVFRGEAGRVLAGLPSKFCRACITSPPYYLQRDYHHADQLGREPTPEAYVARLADVLDEVRRVLENAGSLWVVIDDSYADNQLLGIPWMLAFELKRRGWFLRCDCIWYKTSTRPEAAKNRCSRNHEYLFHFTKMPTGYYFNMDAIREPHTNPWALDCLKKYAERPDTRIITNLFNKEQRYARGQRGMTRAQLGAAMNPKGKNRRSVWSDTKWVSLRPNLAPERRLTVLREMAQAGYVDVVVPEAQVPAAFKDAFEPLTGAMLSVMVSNTNKLRQAHFAAFPEALVAPCILATCPEDGVVLDPFCGSGSTGLAALKLRRKFVGIDLLSRYVQQTRQRLSAFIGA